MDEPLVYEPILEQDGLQVSRSPWGPDDQIGRLNWVTAESTARILGGLDGRRVFDLAVDFFVNMPAWIYNGDPHFDLWMTHTPRGSVNDDLSGAGAEVHERYSYCGDSFATYVHCGTHVDTLVHVGLCGRFWNGWSAAEHLGSRCWTVCGADNYPPIVARGVLLDVAGLHGVERLPREHEIGPDELRAAARQQGVELRRRDVVIVRTGQMTLWPAQEFLEPPFPGITLAAARYLCEEAGAMVVGSDTAAVEAIPGHDGPFAPVHTYFFANAGTPIIENHDLEELAAERLYEFAYIAAPLKLRGATGAFVRPLAVPLRA